jgi:SAM-dependent methyltransferase
VLTDSSPPALFNLVLPEIRTSADVRYPTRTFHRSWTHDELVALFPSHGLRILDVGAGDEPFRARNQDSLTTVDVDPSTVPELTLDITASWPFGAEEFDFVYMSHFVEHLYPQDRDAVIRRVHNALKQGGLVFIRVPHWSSMQGFGWEHYTYYGIHGATSLCHGRNPMLPMFRAVSAAVATSIDFYGARSPLRRTLERLLNARWRLTEVVLCHLVGGIAEVQFLLQRMPVDVEKRLRRTTQVPV